MNLYEFINTSDTITFYAPDDDIAFTVTMYVGNGHSLCERLEDGKHISVKDSIPYLFTKIPEDVLNRFRTIITTRSTEVMESAHTFACCEPGERQIFDEYTNNGSDKEKYEKWDNSHRTSMNGYCKFARSLRVKKPEAATKGGEE